MTKLPTLWQPRQLTTPKKPITTLQPQQLTPLTKANPMKFLPASPNYPSSQNVSVEATEATAYVVFRGRKLVASFTRKSDAANWVRERSYHPDSEATYVIQTGDGVFVAAYRDGQEIEYP